MTRIAETNADLSGSAPAAFRLVSLSSFGTTPAEQSLRTAQSVTRSLHGPLSALVLSCAVGFVDSKLMLCTTPCVKARQGAALNR